MERLQVVVNRCHLRFMFAAWCNFTKDSKRIKQVLKVQISSLWKKGEKHENSINVGTFLFGRGSVLKAGRKSASS